MPARVTRSVETSVLARKIDGYSNSKIAEDLGIHRQTVQRILTGAEFQQAVSDARSDFVGLLPASVKVYRNRLKKNDLRAASEIAHGVGALNPRTESQTNTTININVLNQIQASSDETIAEIESWQTVDSVSETEAK
jgi:DNA-binding IclR family transcriptional regulator